MSPNTDLTKPTSHIYWLWTAVLALSTATLAGYLTLLARDECLAGKISNSEITIKVQLAEIKTTLTNVEAALIEIKKDMKRKEDREYPLTFEMRQQKETRQ